MLEVLGFKQPLKHFSLIVDQLRINKGEVFVLLGPTGAGKSQFIQTLAGLSLLREGKIQVNGQDITQKPPEQRGISILLQSPYLFPHLSVKKNIDFGRKDPLLQEKLVELLNLEQVLDSAVDELSGGQLQLVALARALMVNPEILLLDEAFSALDPISRKLTINGFKRVQTELRTTCLLVTHNFEDCLQLGDQVGILFRGKLVQSGPPELVFSSPSSPEIAHFLGHENVFSGSITKEVNLTIPDHLPFPSLFKTENLNLHVLSKKDGYAHALIHPQEITVSTVAPKYTSALNIFRGQIQRIYQNGPICELEIQAGALFKAIITSQSLRDLSLSKGKHVFLSFKASTVKILQ